jgi:hypothetical protein
MASNRGKSAVVNRFAAIGMILLFAGCPTPQPVVPDAALEAAPVPDSGFEAAVDAGPVLPIELAFAIEFLGLDGGSSIVQSSEAHAEIDPARAMTIQFPVALKDFRVRMFDGAEQVLPSDEEARAQDGGMSYSIALAGPLKAGRSYSFSLESELGHEITDISGHGYRDVLVALKVRGQPEPEPKAANNKKRRRK